LPLSPHLKYLIPGIILFFYGIYWIIYIPISPYLVQPLLNVNTQGNPVLGAMIQVLRSMTSPAFILGMVIMGIVCICIGLPLLIIGIKKKKSLT
jgi:hypothetical protein